MTVVEKPTGNLIGGCWLLAGRKLSLLAGIQQENVFGTGNYLGLNVNTSKFNRQFVLSTTNPYFTEDGISRTLDAGNHGERFVREHLPGHHHQVITSNFVGYMLQES